MGKIENWSKTEPNNRQIMRWVNTVTNEEVSVGEQNRNGTYTINLPGNGNHREFASSKRKARKAAADYMRNNTRSGFNVFEGVGSDWARRVEKEGNKNSWWIGRASPSKTKAKGENVIYYSHPEQGDVQLYRMENKIEEKGKFAVFYEKYGKTKIRYFDERSRAESFMSKKLGSGVSVSTSSRRRSKPRGKTPERLKGRRPRDN